MNETLLTIIFVGGVTAILSFFTLKKKNESWEGVLENKKLNSYTDDEGFTKETCTLIFKTTDGKKKKINLNKQGFDKFEKNKTYIKSKGEFLPALKE